tara:strand:+ start:2173 stop:2559 length:387 start_codon:yes stop_codon:yes gene_type:complete
VDAHPEAPNLGANIKTWGEYKSPGRLAIATRSGLWPTPSARQRTGQASDKTMAKNSRPLDEIASHSGLQAQPTSTDGHECSSKCRRLNPRFVEWLMGWPYGWSNLASSETELSHWQQRMHYALSRLGM